MQVMPDTARELGYDAKDSEANILAGSKYLSSLIEKYKVFPNGLQRAIAAYNSGPGDGEPLSGDPAFPRNQGLRQTGSCPTFRIPNGRLGSLQLGQSPAAESRAGTAPTAGTYCSSSPDDTPQHELAAAHVTAANEGSRENQTFSETIRSAAPCTSPRRCFREVRSGNRFLLFGRECRHRARAAFDTGVRPHRYRWLLKLAVGL